MDSETEKLKGKITHLAGHAEHRKSLAKKSVRRERSLLREKVKKGSHAMGVAIMKLGRKVESLGD